jgi:ketosteroid isomerase-like protein
MKSFTIAIIFMLVTVVASACGSTQPSTDPASVIQAFFEALNAGDLDGAMALVAEDAVFILHDVYTEKAQVRDHYQGEIDRNAHYELSDIQVAGDVVTLRLKETSDIVEFEDPFEGVVQEGKIQSFGVR